MRIFGEKGQLWAVLTIESSVGTIPAFGLAFVACAAS
jgi:hypothetical protein